MAVGIAIAVERASRTAATPSPGALPAAAASRSSSVCGGPNAPPTNRTEYATVSTDPATSPVSVTTPPGPPCRYTLYAASLPTNPASGGTAAIDAHASTAVTSSTRCRRQSPDR